MSIREGFLHNELTLEKKQGERRRGKGCICRPRCDCWGPPNQPESMARMRVGEAWKFMSLIKSHGRVGGGAGGMGAGFCPAPPSSLAWRQSHICLERQRHQCPTFSTGMISHITLLILPSTGPLRPTPPTDQYGAKEVPVSPLLFL